MIRLRTATVTAALIGSALALTACGSSNADVPSNAQPGGRATDIPATAAPTSSPASEFEQRTDCTTGGYSDLGGFSAEQVTAAVTVAQEVTQAAQSRELVSDLVAQTTDERLGYISDYLTADMRTYLADPANATVLEGFVLDPAADAGEQFQTDAYTGVSVCAGVPTLSGPNGDAITVPVDTNTLL
ncbi:hypothetical protein, partial [Modestobacter sp. KNN46-3]|uniref:hypothetical protein n=1 Tax=Modestobacter sp. KNN46-3 TaxID=2711218 RepID=UPI0019D256BE